MKAPTRMSRKDKVELKTTLYQMGAEIDEWRQAGMPTEVTIEPQLVAVWIKSEAGRLAGHLSAGDELTNVIEAFDAAHAEGPVDQLYEFFNDFSDDNFYVVGTMLHWRDSGGKWHEQTRKQIVERLRKARKRRQARQRLSASAHLPD